jgi:hypothetical protein
MTVSTAGPVTRASVPVKLLGIVLAGAAVSIALGVYGRVHDPTGEKPYTLFFSDTINLKVWFATAALFLAAIQVLLALRLFDKIHVPRAAPPWLGDAHRLTGIVAFGLTLPVARREGPAALPARLLLLRRLHHQGPRRPNPRIAELAATRRRRHGVRDARPHLDDERSVVLA